MQAFLRASIINQENSEAFPYLNDSSEHFLVVIKLSKCSYSHNLCDCTETEDFRSLQLLHILQTVGNTFQGIGYHVV